MTTPRTEGLAPDDGLANIYIYSKMEPEVAISILNRELNRIKTSQPAIYQELIDNLQAIWLLRESRESGMLSISKLQYALQNGKGQWQSLHIRMALTNQGWALASTAADLASAKSNMSQQLTAENATQFIQQLDQFTKDRFMLNTKNRINPNEGEESRSDLYNSYRHENTVKTLPKSITDALTCPITNRVFKDPVVSAIDFTFISGPHKGQHIRKGSTYEREIFQQGKKQLTEGIEFYPNHKLKNIIKYIADYINELDKLTKIDEFEINDAVSLDNYQKPQIAPWGKSYSEDTVKEICKTQPGGYFKDPLTRERCLREEFVPNYNLAEFLSGWKRYYQAKQAEHLNSSVKSNTDDEKHPSP